MRILSFSVMVTLGTLASAQAHAQEGMRGGMEMTAPDMVVFFDLDKDQLKVGTEENLSELANWLILGDDRSVVITADSATGTASDIAERRSEQVRDYLVRQGVNTDQITIVEMGDPVELTDNQRIIVTTDRSPSSVGATSDAETYDTGRTTYERPMGATTPPADDELADAGYGMEDIGLSVAAGGGVRGFSDQTTRNATDTGAAWEARVGVGMNNWVGVEAAYIGSWHGLNGQFDSGGSNVDIYGNGVEGNLRVNLTQEFPVQPYVLAGVGWTHYTVNEDGVPAGGTLNDEDNVLETPVGAGVATKIGPALLDVRGTFRPAFDAELFDDALGGSPDLHNWSAIARLGFNI